MSESSPGSGITVPINPDTSTPWWRLLFNAASASCIAEAVSLPLEVAKMRLQLQRSHPVPGEPRYRGMLSAFQTISKQEGITSLWKGIEVGMHKQVLYAGLRLGVYEHLTQDEELPLHVKVMYATATTGLGIIFANPSDVVQTKYIAYRTKHAIRRPMAGGAPAGPVAAAQGAARGSDGARPRAPHNPPADAHQGRRQFSSQGHARSCVHGRQFGWTSPACFPWQHASGALPTGPGRGALSRSTWRRHIYHHHLRHPALQRSSDLNFQRSHFARLPLTPRSVQAHRFSSDSGSSSTGADVRAARPPPPPGWKPRGPKTVTGVPLQNARKAYFIIVREEGLVKGLYRGFWANFVCSCVGGAAEITTYDVTKTAALSAGCPDTAPLHMAAGMMAGLVASVLSNPLDVVATRLMAVKKAHDPGLGTLGTIANMWRHEGFFAFFKGFRPNVLRVGTFNVVMWMSYEQIRRLGA